MVGKQGSTIGTTNAAGVPENVRQAAETTLAQAKQAVDQYLHQVNNLQEKAEASVQVVQSGARDINRNMLAAAEANINATFDFAQQLVQAKDPQEMFALQQRFLQQQFERVRTQAQEVGGAAARTAADLGSTARPKG
ncbi:TIGR01841 family phasin [Microvirga sp. VF16]|uniref:TIGR01841 family phasin n=1 Tax=Microvirga sp. VF16 TaxID=2807101 RepID=UPI00193D0F60|nr:TIGR01841 family phasin [Microvirga sp. VF16]QRM35730.1 TIGR01841 family phasin [Microvirga sp. VF16]